MLRFLRRRWFLIALLILIPLGMSLGYRADSQRVSTFPKYLVVWASGILTAVILFLMSVTLASSKFVTAFRSPGPVLWATTINFILLPVCAMLLLPLQLLKDLAVGLMVVASVPSTLAAASVWTRKAGGNDAVSLLVTIATNGVCFLVTPLWLMIGIGDTVELRTDELILILFITALLPIAAGQSLRLWSAAREFADRRKTGFGALAQGCILAIVFWAAIQGGVKLNSQNATGGNSLGVLPIVVVWLTCVALHLAALFVGWGGGKILGFRREDVVGIMFSGSQKTLPIGLFVAGILASRGLPLAVLPILMFHASQLILDTLFLDPLSRWVAADPVASPRQ